MMHQNQNIEEIIDQRGRIKTQSIAWKKKRIEESQEKIQQPDSVNVQYGPDKKYQFQDEQEWQSQKHLSNQQQGKKQLAALLMSLQLHKMGFAYPSYESQIQDYLLQSNLSQIPIHQLSFWISQSKHNLVELVLSSKKKLPSVKSKSLGISRRDSVSEMQRVSNQVQEPNVQKKLPKIQLMCSICYQLTFDYEKRTCEHNFCDLCIRLHILQNIESGDYELNCPMYECENNIEQRIIKRLLKKAEYSRFLYFRNKAQLQKNPLNKFCSQPDCGQLLQESENGSLKCPKCSKQFCRICLQAFHQHFPCDKTILKALKQTYLKFSIKKCPKCTAPIQKIDGCNHMSCKKCKTQFCWICLNQLSIHHYRYYNCCGCPGLQFGDEEDLPRQKCKQIAMYIFSPIILSLFLIIFFIALPLFMLFCLVSKPCDWVNKFNDKCENSVVKSICCCLPECLRKVIGYVIFLPRAILYAIFIAPVKYFCYFCHGSHDIMV